MHRRKGSYRAYLSNWTIFLYDSRCSLFFFLRPASSLDVAMDPQYNTTQYNVRHFIHISNSAQNNITWSRNILLQDSEKSKVNSALLRVLSQSRRALELEHC